MRYLESLYWLAQMFIERQISYSQRKQKDVFQGGRQLGKNDVTWGQANNTSMPPDQKSKPS